MIEFGDRLEKVRFDDAGIQVNDRFIRWDDVGALGILENATRVSMGNAHGGPMPAKVMGCLAVCVVDEVDVVPAYGMLLDCLGSRPTPAERTRAIEYLDRELGSLSERIPQFAPANVKVEHWWREQVYGNGSHAHTDEERIVELRAELKAMRDRLGR